MKKFNDTHLEMFAQSDDLAVSTLAREVIELRMMAATAYQMAGRMDCPVAYLDYFDAGQSGLPLPDHLASHELPRWEPGEKDKP